MLFVFSGSVPLGVIIVLKGEHMLFKNDPERLSRIEKMLIREMQPDGRIMVRSLDKIHARTGLTYSVLSEMAKRLEDRRIVAPLG
jgi:hypothetical protein